MIPFVTWDSFPLVATTLLLLGLALPAGPSQCHAQSPLDYFPHHTGDTWEYTDSNTGQVELTITIGGPVTNDAGDSLIGYSMRYGTSTSQSYGWFRIDSIYRVFDLPNPDSTSWYLLYRLDARLGNSWAVHRYDTAFRAEVIDESLSAVFRSTARTMKIEYFTRNAGEEQWYEARTIATGFGMVVYEAHPFVRYYLSGAIINGKRYGSLAAADGGSAAAAALAAVPNPFLSGTVISYSVDHPARVRLSLHNMLGREVACLYDGPREAGAYCAGFDGACLPAGAYVARLLVGEAVYHATVQLVR